MDYETFRVNHRNEDGWALFKILEANLLNAQKLDKIMSNLTALTAAVAASTQAVTDLSVSVNAAVAALGSTSDQSAIDALTAQLTAANTALAAAKAQLDAAVATPVPAGS